MELIGPHLLGIQGLTRGQIDYVLDTAEQFVEVNERQIKKVPTLRGKTVINLFLEPSTRTRSSFEIAAKRLSADAVNIGGKDSSVSKGESLMDTALNLQAMAPEILVVRHAAAGAPHFLARYLQDSVIVNAGDGLHEHPTQALLDALTIRQHFGRLDNLTVTFVGDTLRGRVGRSNIHLLKLYGCKLRVVGPPTLQPKELRDLGVEIFTDLEPALDGADVVMSLRVKFEYLNDYFIPNMDEFTRKYCLKESHFEKYAPKAILMAPGPFHRGVDMTTELIDGPRSQIFKQVGNGVAIRMAVLYLLAIQQGVRYAEHHGKPTQTIPSDIRAAMKGGE